MSDLIVDMISHPRWLSNTYLVAEGAGGSPGAGQGGGAGRCAVIIDSGGPAEPILAMVRERQLRVTHLFNTHHHVDHVMENDRLRRATGARLCAHRLEAPLIPGVDQALEHDEVVRTGGLEIRVLHIPGHTVGQTAYVINDEVCFTGDTLFRGSIGGTVGPGHATFGELRASILDRLLALPAGMRVAPGHAAPTTIGEERANNPFIRVMLGVDPEGRRRARFAGRDVALIVWARDYDGGFKAWVRFDDGSEATVPGSRVEEA